ncbi:hypothetical protein MNBD_ALPHA09-280 [hydrothermal vent metagenome]|uniref:DUF4167 domain-containing protein n=1 Tax=hydrothermal vent metagenome TaxID=652676 RepID=A0A3B0T572_9ZZZZ
MRQVQHGRKPRGRGRKQHNPLSRIYDSSGPDTKIRGTAAHIAEKYQSLARDATSSGHRVIAENYLQHAEHYLRIVAVAQAAMQPPAQAQASHGNAGQGDQAQPSERRDGGDEDSGDAAQAGGGGPQSQQSSQGQRDDQGSQSSGRGRRGQRRRQPSFDAAASGDGAAGTDTAATPDGDVPETAPAPAGAVKKKLRSAKADTADDASVNGAAAPDAEAEPAAPPRRRTRRKPKAAEDNSQENAVAADADAVDVV